MKNIAIYSIVALTVTLGACSHQSNQADVLSTTYLGRYGVELNSRDWNSKGRDGQIVSTLKSGVTVTTTYKAGIKEGDTSYTFPYSESIEHVDTYANGKIVAITHHDESGQPSWQEKFPSADRREILVWHRDGSPAVVESYYQDKLITGKYFSKNQALEASITRGDGTRIRRDAYGELLSTETFVNGEMTRSVTVYPNGDPKEITTYQQGLIEGTRQTFYPGGVPKSIEEWSAGSQDGTTILFQNGEKIAQIPYIDGKKQGIEQRFRSGKLTEEISWENDERQGPTHLFIGDQEATQWYYQGHHVSKASYDRLMTR